MSKVPERDGALARKLLQHMNGLTKDRHGALALDNIEKNRKWLTRGESLAALAGEKIGDGDSAIVIAAGPSVKRRDPARQIQAAGYTGATVASESAILYCLRNGVIPSLAVTVDPHTTRVVRWLGDPTLTVEKLREDDYFSRQDQDDAFADEMKANAEILGLLERHGSKIRMALPVTASEAVVQRVFETGMRVYWWIPMLDDPDDSASMTAHLQREFDLPCVNTGGNVGTAAWMMANAVLAKEHIALTGIDFSYYDGTPYANTQYYREAVALVGEENLDALFIRIYNPHLGAWFFTDPAYMWYRESFLEMLPDPDCTTYNCTEGGILFGDGIVSIKLAEFLAQRGGPNAQGK
jgi:hypothetical protein